MTFSVISKKSGKTYYLHSKHIVKDRGEITIYFFKSTDSEAGLSEIPKGFEVWEMPRSGLPMLRRIKLKTS